MSTPRNLKKKKEKADNEDWSGEEDGAGRRSAVWETTCQVEPIEHCCTLSQGGSKD